MARVGDEGWGGRALVVCALLALFGYGAMGVATLLDANAVVYRLNRPVDAVVEGPMLRRLSVVGGGTQSGQPIYCVVIHESLAWGGFHRWRRNATWHYAADGAHVVAAGRSWTLDGRSHDWQFSPEAWRPAEEFRGRLPGVPRRGRMRAQCLHEGERAFLEAVERRDGSLAGDAAHSAVLTVGDGTPQGRIDDEANRIGWRLGWFVTALFALWLYRVKEPRVKPAAELLASMSPRKPMTITREGLFLFGPFVAVVGGAVVDALLHAAVGSNQNAFRVGHTGLFFLVGIGLLTGIFAIGMGVNSRLYRRALEVLAKTPAGTLASVREGVVKLAVKVAPDAPTVHGSVAGPGKAFVKLDIAVWARLKRSIERVPFLALTHPEEVPITDASGNGRMSLHDTTLDLLTVRQSCSQGEVEAVLGPCAPWAGDLVSRVTDPFEVEVRSLAPGDTVFVVGEATRVEDPGGQGDYRVAATQALLRSAPGGKLLVHAGEEDSLVATLRAVLGRAALQCVAGAALAVAAVLAAAWLVAL